MTKKKDQKSKNKKKKITLIFVIITSILILLGCFMWYYYDKDIKESTITHHEFSEEFQFLSASQDYKTSNENYNLIAYDYNLKGKYNIIVEAYQGKKLIDKLTYKVSDEGMFVFKYALVDNGVKYFYYSPNVNAGQYQIIPFNSAIKHFNSSGINTTKDIYNKLKLKGNKKHFLETHYSCNMEADSNDACIIIKFYIQKSND